MTRMIPLWFLCIAACTSSPVEVEPQPAWLIGPRPQADATVGVRDTLSFGIDWVSLLDAQPRWIDGPYRVRVFMNAIEVTERANIMTTRDVPPTGFTVNVPLDLAIGNHLVEIAATAGDSIIGRARWRFAVR